MAKFTIVPHRLEKLEFMVNFDDSVHTAFSEIQFLEIEWIDLVAFFAVNYTRMQK